MKNWIINNFWIKIVSLMLAIITWFYVNGELVKEERISRKYKSSFLKDAPDSPSLEKRQMNRGYVVENK